VLHCVISAVDDIAQLSAVITTEVNIALTINPNCNVV